MLRVYIEKKNIGISRANDTKTKLFLTSQFLLVQKDQDSTGLKWKLLTLYASSRFFTMVCTVWSSFKYNYLLMSPSRISTFPNCGEWRTLMFWWGELASYISLYQHKKINLIHGCTWIITNLKLKGFVQKGRILNFGRFSFFAGSS